MATSLLSLEPSTRASYRRALAQLRTQGVHVITTSTRRTKNEQRVLFRKFVTGQSKFPAALPGSSTHEIGIAIDLVPETPGTLPTIASVMAIHGFKWAEARDCVHFTYRPDLALIRAPVDFGRC